MKTMLLMRPSSSSSSMYCCQKRYWSMISSAMRLRLSPIFPVAQNPQRMAQPTCEETQIVQASRLFFIRTVSICLSPATVRMALWVSPFPLLNVCCASTDIQGICAILSRMVFEREVRLLQSRADENSPCSICFQRKAGSLGKSCSNCCLRDWIIETKRRERWLSSQAVITQQPLRLASLLQQVLPLQEPLQLAPQALPQVLPLQPLLQLAPQLLA